MDIRSMDEFAEREKTRVIHSHGLRGTRVVEISFTQDNAGGILRGWWDAGSSMVLPVGAPQTSQNTLASAVYKDVFPMTTLPPAAQTMGPVERGIQGTPS